MISATGRDFADLVGYNPRPGPVEQVHGTTVLAVRFDQGALVLADRRATMGNLIMYEDAEKIEALDDTVVVAISGAYARSIEVCRYLKHAFKYYERLNLVEISAEGKLMEISRALASNIEAAMQGSVFLPIAAAYDKKTASFGVYFFDTAGARFLGSDYAAAGSGSERIRGTFEYIAREKGPWSDQSQKDALQDALRLLDLASQLDSATGGVLQNPPSIAVLTGQGVQRLSQQEVADAVAQTFGQAKNKTAPAQKGKGG